MTGSLNASLAMRLLSSGKAAAPYMASQGTVLGHAGLRPRYRRRDGSIWIDGGTRKLISGSVRL